MGRLTTRFVAPQIIDQKSMRYTNINQFIFGIGPYAGIGCITGDAGVDASELLSKTDFINIVNAYLEEADYLENIAVLRSEFAAEVDELYEEYVEQHEARSPSIVELLSMPVAADIEFEPPKAHVELKRADIS